MRIICVGGCGYIGAQLVPVLLSRGHTVCVLDEMWFGDGSLPKDNGHLSRTLEWKFAGFDAVIDLAFMTNNAMCELNPVLDHRNNRERFSRFAIAAKDNGIKHYIYASSVAAYGSTNEPVAEDAHLRPTTLYGASKAYCEAKAIALASDSFSVTIVRSASVVGASMNMRFDTTMNKMTHDAVRHGVIRVNGGNQVRTHVSIKDLCDFYCLCLESKATGAYNLVDRNMTVAESAKMVATSIGVRIEYVGSTDQRSYAVDGNKAIDLGWAPTYGIERAIGDIKARFVSEARNITSEWKDSATNAKYQRMRYDLA